MAELMHDLWACQLAVCVHSRASFMHHLKKIADHINTKCVAEIRRNH